MAHILCLLGRFNIEVCFPVNILWRGRRQFPVLWYLHTFRITPPFLIRLTAYSTMIAWHPTSHNFPIEVIDIYERPGSKCASIPLYVNCGNDSAHAVFDSFLLINSDKTNCVTLFVCIWLGIVWTDVCDRCSCIRTIYCVGVANIFDIMGHLYNIILIGFPWYLCSYHKW